MVDITDVTTGTVDGTGHFDKMMAAINAQIDVQFKAGRIQSKDYATVYLGAIQAALAQAVAYVGVVEQVTASTAKTAKESALYDEKVFNEQAKRLDTVNGTTVAGEIGIKKTLQTAQADGFARDAEQKVLKIVLDAWSVAKSAVPDTTTNPTLLDEISPGSNSNIDDLIYRVRKAASIDTSDPTP